MTHPYQTSLRELATLFLRLGATAFGGPAVHIAMMEDEVVRRRGWLDRGQFVDCLGAVNLLPGPNSTELALHIGFLRAGWRGLLVAGATFVGPAAILVGVAAWAYVRFGTLPPIAGAFYGIKPVMIGILLQAIGSLSNATAPKLWLRTLAIIAFAASLLGMNELAVLALTGAVTAAIQLTTNGRTLSIALVPLAAVFTTFLKIGSILYGSGYVLVAYLRSDFVERLHWLTEAQLLDAVAIGQMTPGPVLTTATFIGYLLGGPLGAIVATVGIFLPAFILVGVCGPLLPRLRRSALAGAFLDGVNVASLALMAGATCRLATSAVVDTTTAGIAMLSAFLLMRLRINSMWLLLAGALVGLVAPR